MNRQIEAMEREDFESLGQAVFARGFVRNYARLLGLAPDPLLANMSGAPADAAPVSRVVPPPSSHWLTSPWLILLLLGMLMAIAVPVALYWWLNSDVETKQPAESAPPAKVARVPVPASSAASPAEVRTSPVVAPDRQPAVQDGKDLPVAPGSLQLEFSGESWVEIRDADGQAVLRQLNQAGSRVEVRGRPPLDVLIGNAGQVRLSFNGRPINLKPFIDVSVARFTLEE
jgi:cytoskeleton protein RodZ